MDTTFTARYCTTDLSTFLQIFCEKINHPIYKNILPIAGFLYVIAE